MELKIDIIVGNLRMTPVGNEGVTISQTYLGSIQLKQDLLRLPSYT
jgi:hypothetical protein